MKIKWIKQKDKKPYTTDITQAVTRISWSGSTSQAARTAEIEVINAPNDKLIKALKLNIGAGDSIKIEENGKTLFIGEVQSTKKRSETGTISYTCYDFLNHLLRSVGNYNFRNATAEKITKMICADLGIKTGQIAETRIIIPKLIVESSTYYDIIMKAYTKAAKQTKEKYICRMDGTKLSIAIKGEIVKDFVLAEEYNITNAEHEESIENMVNVVKIYNEKGVQTGEVKNDKWIEKYGVYQQTYTQEKGVNATVAAKKLLQGIEKRVTLDGIEGNLDCIAGNGVQVYDKATRLNGLFWIDSDTHTWENGIHTMNLELNFKNIMDSKE